MKVVICFQISIFEPLETTYIARTTLVRELWFAFKLVSLNHWKQHSSCRKNSLHVVICFQISIFEPLETTRTVLAWNLRLLWFAFKLVSLNHWKQPYCSIRRLVYVVICFQISIFEPLETTHVTKSMGWIVLWFAFKLVSLNHWKQHDFSNTVGDFGCDLLSN